MRWQRLAATLAVGLILGVPGLVAAPRSGASALPPPNATPGELLAVAGGANGPGLGNGGPALFATLADPEGVAVDSNGDVFIADADDNMIREVSPSGKITDFAGDGVAGYTGDGEAATKAELDHPTGVAVDSSGDVFIADSGNNVIREVSAGTITTYAGNGTAGYSGDGGAPSKAQLNDPTGVAIGPGDSLAIADTDNCVVRLVYFQRTINNSLGAHLEPWVAKPARPGGPTRPGGGSKPKITVGTLKITTVAGNQDCGEISSGDGGPATDATLNWPTGVAFDSSGNLYIADTGDSAIREVTGDGIILTAIHTPYPTSVVVSPTSGDLFIADPVDNEIKADVDGVLFRIAGDIAPGSGGYGGKAVKAFLNMPMGVGVDQYGDLFIDDTGNNRVDEDVSARPPTFIVDSPPVVVAAKAAYTYTFTAVGVPEPTYSLGTGAPSWMTINAATGAVGGTVPAGTKEFSYSVVATNPSGSATAGPYTVAIPELPIYLDASHAGAMSEPVGLGVDPSGNIWVADVGDSHILELSPTNVLQKNISEYDGTLKWNAPQGVAASASNLYVADTANNRFEEISLANGDLILKSGSGALNDPRDIGVSPNGNLYVVDSGNNRIVEYTTGGTVVRTFGSVGHGNGQFETPTTLAFDAAGDVYVADSGNKRIEEFSSNGAFIRALTLPNSAGIQGWTQPWGVAIDSHNDIWVADKHSNTITELSSTGQPALQFGTEGTNATDRQFDEPTDIAVSPSGVISIVDSLNKRVDQFGIPTGPQFTTDSPPLTANGGTTYTADFAASGYPAVHYVLVGAPAWLSVSSTGVVSGTVPSSPSSFSYSVEAENSAGTATVGPYSVEVASFTPLYYSDTLGSSSELTFPEGVAEDSSGDVWVANNDDNDVVEYSPTGSIIQTLGVGDGVSPIDDPTGLAFVGNDLFIANVGQIAEYDVSGTPSLVQTFGSEGSANGELEHPEGITVASSGDIWVADTGNSRIEEFTSSGVYMSQFAVSEPEQIAFDSAGNLVVANQSDDEVQIYSTAGTLLSSISSPTSGAGQFAAVFGIAVDAGNNIFIGDGDNSDVVEYSESGIYEQTLGALGSGPGDFFAETFLTISPDNVLTVGDTENDNVVQYAPAAAPSFTADSPPTSVVGGDSYSYQFEANGVPPPTWTLASGAPAWLSIDATTGAVSGTVPSDITSFSFGVVATNVAGSQTAGPFTVTVTGGTPSYYVGQFGSGTLIGPADVVANSAGGYLVVDKFGGDEGIVDEYSSAGVNTGNFGSGTLIYPDAIVESSTNIYVGDYGEDGSGNATIWSFTTSGTSPAAFATVDAALGYRVGGLSIDSAGNLWVAVLTSNLEDGDGYVEELSSTGTELTSFYAPGLDNPTNIAALPDGDIAVTSYDTDRIDVLTTAGTSVHSLTEPNEEDFYGVAADPSGNIFATANGEIDEYNSSGTFVKSEGGSGSDAGDVDNPEGISVSSSDVVTFGDYSNGRCEQFQF